MAAQLRDGWGRAWLLLCLALALHVADEVMTGFLDTVWNPLVQTLRQDWSWVPFPTFRFDFWLGGLTAGIVLLLCLTPQASRGRPWMRPISWFLAVLMLGNGAGHVLLSLVWGRPAPGAFSSPLLIAAALYLMSSLRTRSEPLDKPEGQ